MAVRALDHINIRTPDVPGTVAFFRDADRRDADLVAAGELALRLRPAPVHPHLAAAHDLVDQRAGRALQLPQQEVVQPLALPILGDADGTGSRAVGGGFWHEYMNG